MLRRNCREQAASRLNHRDRGNRSKGVIGNIEVSKSLHVPGVLALRRLNPRVPWQLTHRKSSSRIGEHRKETGLEKAVKVMGFKPIKANSEMGTPLPCLGLLPKVTNNSAPLTSACTRISSRLRRSLTGDAGRYVSFSIMKAFMIIVLLQFSFVVNAATSKSGIHVLSETEVLEFAVNYLATKLNNEEINIIEEISFIDKEHKFRYEGYNYWYLSFKCNETLISNKNRNSCPNTLEISDEHPPRLINHYQDIF